VNLSAVGADEVGERSADVDADVEGGLGHWRLYPNT
jgi:hypothetical protein